MWKKILDEVTPYKPGKPIEEVKRELGLEDVIKLASNESPFPPSPKVIEAIEKNAQDVNRYPDGGCFYLRDAISKKLGIFENNIVFGNGSDEIIIMALRAFVHPGEEVIISDPTFMIYRIASVISGAKVEVTPAKNYRYDLDAMLEKITDKTKMIFIANPDNPTGTYANSNELDSFLRNVPENIIVFIDEAYYEFARGEDYPETVKYIENSNCNVIIARTFSKAYSLAGLRVGYGIAREDIASALNKVREPFNINSIAQVAALAALEDEKYMLEKVSFMNNEKARMCKELEAIDIEFVPSRTNFILIDTKRDSSDIFDYLIHKGIIVRDMAVWGLKGFIRVNMGMKEENDSFLKVFSEAIEKIPCKL